MPANVLFAQFDYCYQINTAIAGIKNNFSDYQSYAYDTQGGQKAYRADFSFVIGAEAYIFKDFSNNNHEFYQVITTDVSQYGTIFNKIESCLVNRQEEWTKMESDDKTLVMFLCEDFGGEITLAQVKGEVVIQISRDEKRNIPVCGPDFCNNLFTLTGSIDTDFEGTRGTQKDSDTYGVLYTTDFKLNQRGFGGTAYVGVDMFDPKKNTITIWKYLILTILRWKNSPVPWKTAWRMDGKNQKLSTTRELNSQKTT
jgi:hypothetical protein